MNYQVEYRSQDWAAAEIQADSPREAAKLYLRQDSEKRWQDYDEVVVFWGLFGKQTDSFRILDLLPTSGSENEDTASSDAPPIVESVPGTLEAVPDPTGPFAVAFCLGLALMVVSTNPLTLTVPVAMGLTTYFSYKRGFNAWFWVFAGAGAVVFGVEVA